MQSSNTFISSVHKALSYLKGSYGLGIISSKYPNQIIAAKMGSPLVIGIGKNGNYIASDQMALLSVTKKFIFLEDGDIAVINEKKINIYDKNFNIVNRPIKLSNLKEGQISKGVFDHFMQKEIFEQPQAIRDTLESRISNDSVIISASDCFISGNNCTAASNREYSFPFQFIFSTG